MSKPSKPRVDRASLVRRLEHAQKRQLFVRLRRWIPDSDRIDGFVVGIGRKWITLQVLSDFGVFDGWTLLRLKDLQSVSVEPDPDCFPVAALKARQLWPPAAPEVILENTAGAVECAARVAPLITVFDEFYRPEACWIGSVRSVNKKKLWLLQIDPRAQWDRKPRTFDLRDVTRLEVGGGYEEALHLVVGLPPKDG